MPKPPYAGCLNPCFPKIPNSKVGRSASKFENSHRMPIIFLVVHILYSALCIYSFPHTSACSSLLPCCTYVICHYHNPLYTHVII